MDIRPCSSDPDLWFGYADDDASDGAAKARLTSSRPLGRAPSACAAARWPSSGNAPAVRWRRGGVRGVGRVKLPGGRVPQTAPARERPYRPAADRRRTAQPSAAAGSAELLSPGRGADRPEPAVRTLTLGRPAAARLTDREPRPAGLRDEHGTI